MRIKGVLLLIPATSLEILHRRDVGKVIQFFVATG
jgi:hypothetical protein